MPNVLDQVRCGSFEGVPDWLSSTFLAESVFFVGIQGLGKVNTRSRANDPLYCYKA